MPSCRASACSYCKRLIVDPVNALERDSSVKPDTGNPSVRFDEGGGGRETCPSATLPVNLLLRISRAVAARLCRPLQFEFRERGAQNELMVIPGRVRNGVVVLEGGPALPEGMAVTVSCNIAPAAETAKQKRRVDLPLVPSKSPGTLNLTAEHIAELLEEDESPFLIDTLMSAAPSFRSFSRTCSKDVDSSG